jgi:hypothetical protein
MTMPSKCNRTPAAHLRAGDNGEPAYDRDALDRAVLRCIALDVDPVTALDAGAQRIKSLNAGRERAIASAKERAAHTDRIVRRALDREIAGGYGDDGRIARISQATGITWRTVQRSLQRLSA